VNAQKSHIPANIVGKKEVAAQKYIQKGLNFLESRTTEMKPIATQTIK
jgi:hypothetical protein